jgi:hypothetical protein
MDDKEFILDWLIKSQQLLNDELDQKELERMTTAELFGLAEERQKKLREAAEAQSKEADQLAMYGRCKTARISGVVKGGRRG